MRGYLFELGHKPEISTAEIMAVLSSTPHSNSLIRTHNNKHYLLINSKIELDCEKLIFTLGGTIKIGREIPVSNFKLPDQINTISNYLIDAFPTGKIEFSLDNPKLAIQIKKELKTQGRNARYIEPKNTATILHNKLVEKKSDITIIDNQIFVTEAVQPFEEFAKRDFKRPGFDDKSGMLPPKLARIMINLAQISFSESLLDPFCGSGTVLTEAATMGFNNLLGADISEKAVSDSKKNLDWISKTYNLKPKTVNLFASDATKISNLIQPNSIDAIITEPYLGKPLHGNESKQFIEKQSHELKNLYLNSFKEFHKILTTNGLVVMVIPKFKLNNNWIPIDCIQEIQNIGFCIQPFNFNNATIQQSLFYHRENQHLGREIWRFQKIP